MYDGGNLPLEYRATGDMLRFLGIGVLSTTCEFPYWLVNKVGNLFGADDFVYYNKDGDEKFWPSRIQRHLHSKAVEISGRLSEYCKKTENQRMYGYFSAQHTFRDIDRAAFDTSIKEHRWISYITL